MKGYSNWLYNSFHCLPLLINTTSSSNSNGGAIINTSRYVYFDIALNLDFA
jgi:hypothetical protein